MKDRGLNMDVQGRVRAPRGQAGASTTAVDAGKRQKSEPSATSVDSGAAVHGHFAGIGLPEEAGWYVSAALYWICGVSILAIERISGADVIDPVIGILAMFLLACTPLLLLGAHFAPNAAWGPHVRIAIPYAVLAIGAFVVGEAIGPLVLLVMFPLLAVAFLHEWRISVPYCVMSIAYMVGALLAQDSSDAQLTRVVVLAGTMTAIVTGLIFAQRRQRRIAALNHSLSVTDPLTGLANLRLLQTRLRQEIQRSSRAGSEVVLFAIDLDDFKEVNDRFSYELGDNVLRVVAHALSEEMEPGDLLVRRGGDEFAVLTLSRADRDLEAYKLRLRAAIVTARHTICPDVNPEASITMVIHELGESPESLLRRLDDGLHDAKVSAHPERALHEPSRDATSDSLEPVFAAGLEEDDGAAATRRGPRIASAHSQADARMAWLLAAAGAFVPAVILTAIAVADIAPDMISHEVTVLIAGMYMCGFGSLLAAQLNLRPLLMHVPLAVSMVLMTAVISEAEQSSMALVELYAIPTPLVVYLLGWRQAMPYAVVSAAAYSYFLLSSGYDYALMQIGLFIGIMAVLNVLLARGQRMTRTYLDSAEELSVVDPLTGAANLRGYKRRVAEEIERCELLGDDLVLMMIDLEDFKFVNDRYSHTMGDAVLVETAEAIRSVAREDELVVRRGGDEFVVVCAPEQDTDLGRVAQRIANAITDARIQLTPDLPAGATVTAVRWQRDESMEALTQRADESLRVAKEHRSDRSAVDRVDLATSP